jgi:hypothetical protein
VFLFEAKEVLPNLVIYEILGDVSPAFGRTGVMNDQEDGNQDADATCCIETILETQASATSKMPE